jgi:hypothetical protein
LERVHRITRLLPLAAALALTVALPAAAEARSRPALQALQDRVPARTAFRDRVVTGGGVRAHAAAGGTTATYRTQDGTPIRITVDGGLSGDTAAKAQSYADFLGTLPHGSELSSLRVLIVAAADVGARCGADGEDILACYLPGTRTMIVPGDREEAGGVTTSFVIAHEYGHHVAANRSNAPFSALDYGPKRWASYERVCSRTLDGRLAPGDEGDGYVANPGEAWAESYAHLVPEYRDVEWDFTRLLAPSSGSLAAALADVQTPWTTGQVRTFRGAFGSGGATVRRFRFKVRLDGAMRVTLSGPSAAQYDLRLSAGGSRFARSEARGSRDHVTLRAACRTERGAETVTVAVLRRSGAGPFRLTARYAG